MGGSGRSLLMHGPFGLNGFDLMRGPFGLNGFECSWVLLGAPGVLLDALGKLLDAPGGSWVFVGAPGVVLLGCSWVRLVILTSGAALWLDRRYNDPPKQSILSALTEPERVLVCWIRILS